MFLLSTSHDRHHSLTPVTMADLVSSMLDSLDRRTVVTTATAFTLGLLVRGFLVPQKHGHVVPSPLTTLLPKIPAEQHAELPYPPDSLPGARDVVTPYGTIRVYEFGPEDGRKVLMVHGISTPCLALGCVAHALADKGCRVMLFDLFGRGYSENPGDLPHDLRLFSTQILLALSSSPLPWKRFSMIGYSLGGGISAGFTSYFPEMVEALVLLCPSGLIRQRHISKTSRVLYSEGVIPEPLLLRLVKRRLKTPLYPPKQQNDDKIGATKAAKAEVPIESNSTAMISKKYPNVTIDKAIVHQVDYHEAFAGAFMSSIRYGPIQYQHARWTSMAENLKQRSSGDNLHKVLIVAGEFDSIIDATELREDATELLGDHLEYHVVSAGHDAPIVKGPEIVELIWKAWQQ
jgi:pimeloyl-ACP methyl ester carboxylesterase